jgi:hypothetical protein
VKITPSRRALAADSLILETFPRIGMHGKTENLARQRSGAW